MLCIKMINTKHLLSGLKVPIQHTFTFSLMNVVIEQMKIYRHPTAAEMHTDLRR